MRTICLGIVRLCLFGVSVLTGAGWIQPATADIIPDTTLPVNSVVTAQDNIRIIEGGTLSGNNLFHSFREFSFSAQSAATTGDTAFINNDLAVQNIIARITGGFSSNIDGLIQSNGTANLFLINPNGIIFGPNASLQIGGSFLASTADSLKFADGTEFSAVLPQSNPLLTISLPIGLQFGANPGEIQSVDIPTTGGLQVVPGRTLALVGGTISLPSQVIVAEGGRIELGSVAGPSTVQLSSVGDAWFLGYDGVQAFQDIQVSQGAVIDASGAAGGGIQIQGRIITLSDGSFIIASTQGSGRGQPLIVSASDSLMVSGEAAMGTFSEGEGQAGDIFIKARNSIKLIGLDGPSFIASQAFGDGNGGDISVETPQLFVQNGGVLDASTFGSGNAGKITINASDSIELSGTASDTRILSLISTLVGDGAVDNAGDAGDLIITTSQLSVLGGAQISTVARTGGLGGAITINASDYVLLSGTSPTVDQLQGSSGIFVSAEPGATRDAGTLNLTARELTVESGAKISADNFGTAQGGVITLNIQDLTIQNGGLVRAGSFGDGPGGTLNIDANKIRVDGISQIGADQLFVPSALFTEAQSNGAAGDLNIRAQDMIVSNAGQVTLSSQGTGAAGTLQLETQYLLLTNNAEITSTSRFGNGGNLLFYIGEVLLLSDRSRIATDAGLDNFSGGTGGNISLDVPFIVATGNSDITANAYSGSGGRVDIATQSLLGIQYRPRPTDLSDITASSEFGQQGTVTINGLDIDPSRGLNPLPTTTAVPQPSQGCQTGGTASPTQVEFFVSGRGGQRSTPEDPLSGSEILDDLRIPSVAASQSVAQPQPIQEATHWTIGPSGKINIVANATILPIAHCHLYSQEQ